MNALSSSESPALFRNALKCMEDGGGWRIGEVFNVHKPISAIHRVCARLTGKGGKVYFVDAPDVMETRIRDELG